MELASTRNATTILYSPFSEDVPDAFMYSNSKDGVELHGPYAQLIWNFAYYSKFALQLDAIEKQEKSKVYKRIERGQYNLSLHAKPYTRPINGLEFSYPVSWVKHCIMVPLQDELPKYLYVLLPFGRYIWTLIGFSILYIAFLLRWVRSRNKRMDHSFSSNLLKSVAIVLYSPNMNLGLHNTPTRVKIFYTLLFVFGFILNSYYAPYLTAYNMKPIFFPAVNTLQDLMETNLDIVVPHNYLGELETSTFIDIPQLQPYIRHLTCAPFLQLVNSFNRSFAYIVSLEQWNFLNRQQRHLKKPIFHLTDVCFGANLNVFPLQVNASFAASLHSFILAVHQSGLWVQWQEQAFNIAIAAGYTSIRLDTYPVRALNTGFFIIAWIVLAAGLSASCAVFAIETQRSGLKTKQPHRCN